jgi:two-component system KDP operon response regulator KdpE
MTHAAHILIVDDEEDIRNFLRVALSAAGFTVSDVENAHYALKTIEAKPPDLVILDLGLPDMDGKALLEKVRTWSPLPVIVLSARDQEQEKVAALEAGADDYLTKPFGTAELLARVRVALRHASRVEGQKSSVYRHDGLSIDLALRQVMLDRQDIRLTPTEYKLLEALARQPGKVVLQSALINAVWGKNAQGNSQYLRIYIQHLRNKLGDDPLKPRFIITDPGIGYRLITD